MADPRHVARRGSTMVLLTLVLVGCASGRLFGGPTPPPTPTPSPSPLVVAVSLETAPKGTLAFVPPELSVPAGANVVVTFTNGSDFAHNLTFGPPIDAGSSAAVAPGVSEPVTFTAPAPGDYAFMCLLHPGMEGTLHVTGS